jgi:glutamine synthetase
MSDSARRALGIKTLPRALQDSIDALKNDKDFLKPYFSNELLDTYVEIKCEEISFAKDSKERQFKLYYDI